MACGKPQPIRPGSEGEDYFAAFGVPRRFGQDLKELERRFFQVSRALHPDRFGAAESSVRALSLERMSYLNQAYNTLRDRSALRQYLLQLYGMKDADPATGGRHAAIVGCPPTALAEAWFEVQEAVLDSPEEAAEKLREFEVELETRERITESELARSEAEIDRALEAGVPAPSSELLSAVAVARQNQSYLRSMKRDVERLRSKVVK